MKRKKTRNSGITLIALIITIIVLLILAGISIASITGDNGVINKANKARVETDKATVLEQIQLAVIASYGTDGEIDTTKLENELKNYFANDVSIEKGTNGALPWTATDNGYKFEITANGRVQKVMGVILSTSTLELEEGEEQTLTAELTEGSSGTIVWESSAPAVATVVNGKVTAVGAGTAEIIAKIQGTDYSSKCSVTVTQPFTSNLTDAEKSALTANGIVEWTPEEIRSKLENADELIDNPKVKAVLEDGVVIPTGFTYKEGKKDEGVVVVNDKDSSEFVWVPVDEPSSMYGTDESGKKWGKLYNETNLSKKNNWDFDANGNIVIRDAKYLYREPDITSYDDGSDSNSKTYISYINDRIQALGTSYTSASNWLTNGLQKEFNNMIESIEKYRGFYVGRYETSLKYSTDTVDGSSSIANDSNVVQSKANKLSATAENSKTNMWYGLYASQRMYATETNTEAVESSMIWGSQYDAMMKWMDSNYMTVTSSTVMSGTAKNTSRITGNASYNDQLNKVYDLYGNSYEWTIETYYTNYRTPRGGIYSTTTAFAPSRRFSYNYSAPAYVNLSSRLTLYVK